MSFRIFYLLISLLNFEFFIYSVYKSMATILKWVVFFPLISTLFYCLVCLFSLLLSICERCSLLVVTSNRYDYSSSLLFSLFLSYLIPIDTCINIIHSANNRWVFHVRADFFWICQLTQVLLQIWYLISYNICNLRITG